VHHVGILYGHEIIEFPLQQWLRERTKILYYTYIACHVVSDE